MMRKIYLDEIAKIYIEKMEKTIIELNRKLDILTGEVERLRGIIHLHDKMHDYILLNNGQKESELRVIERKYRDMVLHRRKNNEVKDDKYDEMITYKLSHMTTN